MSYQNPARFTFIRFKLLTTTNHAKIIFSLFVVLATLDASAQSFSFTDKQVAQRNQQSEPPLNETDKTSSGATGSKNGTCGTFTVADIGGNVQYCPYW